MKAIVVLSGGQDSTTCLYWAKGVFDEVHAITFDYGQRHAIELDSARKIANMAEVASHEVVDIRGMLQGANPLLDHSLPLEQHDAASAAAPIQGPRNSFVPMRNQLFLTIAANRAYSKGCGFLVTGTCQTDNNGYPDCTREFLDSFTEAANIGTFTEDPLTIIAPLMNLTKSDTVKMASLLPGCMAALAFSHTAYDGKYPPASGDHANVTRAAGFAEAGVPDPLVLRAWREGLMPLPDSSNYDTYRGQKQ